MKTIKKNRKRVIIPLLFIIMSAIVIFNVIRLSGQGQNNVITYKVEGGWGYRIKHGDKTIVDQPFIPLLPGRTPFPTSNSAKKTGKLVLSRLENGVVPAITYNDLKKLKLVE